MEQSQEPCVTAGIEFQNKKTVGVFVNPLKDLAPSDTSNIEYGSHFEPMSSLDLMVQKPLPSGEPTMPEGFEFLEDLLCVPEAEDQFDPTTNVLGQDLLNVSEIVDETQQNKQLHKLSMSTKVIGEDLKITDSECSYVSRDESKVCESLVRYTKGEIGPLLEPFTSDDFKFLNEFLRMPKAQQLTTEAMDFLEQGQKQTSSSDSLPSTNSPNTSLKYDEDTDVSKEYKSTPFNEILIKEQILSKIYPRTTALCTGNPVKPNLLKTNITRKEMYPTSKRIQRTPKGSLCHNISPNNIQIPKIGEKSSVFSEANFIVKQQAQQNRKSSISEACERPSEKVNWREKTCASEKKSTLSKFGQSASIKEHQLGEMSPFHLSGAKSCDEKEQLSGNSQRDVINNERKSMSDLKTLSKRISKERLNKDCSKNQSVKMDHGRESRVANHGRPSGDSGRHISKLSEARASKTIHCSGLPSENKPREDEEEKYTMKLAQNILKTYEIGQEESTKIQKQCLVSQENVVKKDSDMYMFRFKSTTEKFSKEHATTEKRRGISGQKLVSKPLAKEDEVYSRKVVAIDSKRASEKERDESQQKQVSQLVSKGKLPSQGQCKEEQLKPEREFFHKPEKRKCNDCQSTSRDSTTHDASYKVTKKRRAESGSCSYKASGHKVAISPKNIFETKRMIEESSINMTKYHMQSIKAVRCASSKGVPKTYRTPQDEQGHAKAIEILREDLKLSDDSDNEPISSEIALNRPRTTSRQEYLRSLQELGKSKTTTAISSNSETCKKVKESVSRQFTTKSTPTMVRKPSRESTTKLQASSPSSNSKLGEQKPETQRPTLTPKFQQEHKKQEMSNPTVHSITPKSESQKQESKHLSVKQKIIATNYSTDSMTPLVIKPVKNVPNRKLLARLAETKLEKSLNSNTIGRPVQLKRFMPESNTNREKVDHSLDPFHRKGTIDQIRLSKVRRLNQENNKSLEQQVHEDKENITIAVGNELEKDALQKIRSEDISGSKENEPQNCDHREEQSEKLKPITLVKFLKRTTSNNVNKEKSRKELPKTPTPMSLIHEDGPQKMDLKELIVNGKKIHETLQFEGRDNYSEREKHINSIVDTPIAMKHCQPGRPTQEKHPIYENSERKKQGSLVTSLSPGRTASRGNRSGEKYARLENEMRKKLVSLSSHRSNGNEYYVENINDLLLYKTNLKEQIAKENRDQWELLLTNSQSSQTKNKDRVLQERRSQDRHQLKILSGKQQRTNIQNDRDNKPGEKQSFVKTSTGQHYLALSRENRAPERSRKCQDSFLLRMEAERAQGENRRHELEDTLFGEKRVLEKQEIWNSENNNAQKIEINLGKEELGKLSNWQDSKTSNVGQGCMSPNSQTEIIDIGKPLNDPVLDVSFFQQELSELVKGEENRSSSRKRSKEKKRKKHKDRSSSRSRQKDRSLKEKKKKS